MQSMDEIYQKYAKTVYRFLMAKTGNPDLAEELTQETFYQAIKSIDRFDGSCKLSTWLCAIAGNQLMVYYRKNPAGDDLEQCREIAAGRTVEEEVLAAQSKVSLMKKLHTLGEPYREILYLRIFGNLSFKEIGEIMGQTENWARVNFYRGKEKMRKEMMVDEE